MTGAKWSPRAPAARWYKADREDVRLAIVIKVNQPKNWMHLVFSGLISDEELRKGLEDALAACKSQLRVGFGLITDLREARPLSATGKEIMGECQVRAVQLGMVQVIRVLGQSQVVGMQIENTGSSSAGYHAAGVTTSLEEAEKQMEAKLRPPSAKP